MLVIVAVNVDEWLKSANSLSPNDMEAGKIFSLQLLCIYIFCYCQAWLFTVTVEIVFSL